MITKYWIKLYHEILNDRKMVTLSDDLWRFAIECFLLAGMEDDDGYLPEIADIAFASRKTEEQTETYLNELIRVGILEFTNGKYYVVNFTKRQEPMDKAEYQRRRREETKRDKYYPDASPDVLPDVLPIVTNSVTIGHTKPEERREEKSRIDKEIDIDTEPEVDTKFAEVADIYQSNIGIITPILREELIEIADVFPVKWFKMAVKEAVTHEARNLKYVKVILDRWKVEGFKVGKKVESISTEADRSKYAEWET